MKTKENAQKDVQVTNTVASAAKENAAKVVAGMKYKDRLAVISGYFKSPSKCINNALLTAEHFTNYFAAVQALWDAKKIDTKSILNYILGRYKGATPKKGYSEYYVHQYLQKAIKENLHISACRNYYIANKLTEEAKKVAAK